MKQTKGWIILSALALLASAAFAVIGIAVGACTGQIETTMGSTVPMKCHWTMKAVLVVSVLPILVSLAQFAMKEKKSRRVSVFPLLISAIVVFVLTTGLGIGVCAASGMACGKMALLLRIDAVVLAVISMVQWFGAAGTADRQKLGF